MLIYQRLKADMDFSELHRVSLTDLNRRPPACHAGALPTELKTRYSMRKNKFVIKLFSKTIIPRLTAAFQLGCWPKWKTWHT